MENKNKIKFQILRIGGMFLLLASVFVLGQMILADNGKEVTILNVHSHPQAGDYWTVSFETTGTADLTITPDDRASIDDLDFVSLKCGGAERAPQILEGDIVSYPDWSCQETGEITHLVNVAGEHTLKFQFGEKTAFAYNNPDESTYNFVGVTQESNNYYAYEKSGAATFASQDDIGDSEATNTDYDNIESSNDVRWTTEGATTDGHYDSQLYKFYIAEDESSVTQLDFKWEGYGETHGTGYPTDFYAWNYNTSAWDLLQEVTFTSAADQNLTGTKTTDAGNYIKDVGGEVTLMVKTKKYVWSCGGTLTDSRDSKTYATVQIGNQCWMAANFNVGTKLASGSTMPSDPFDYDNPEKWCYNNDDALCTSEGGLYTWAEMMGFSSSCLTTDCSGQIQSPHQGICLSGWHIPTDSEWTTLTGYLSANSQYWCGENSTYIAKSLASASGWSTSTNTCAVGNDQGTNNTTGFTVGPAGYRNTNGGYYLCSSLTYLWAASQNSATNSWTRRLHYLNATVGHSDLNKATGFSVRCVRD